jgi:hypothetical protein
MHVPDISTTRESEQRFFLSVLRVLMFKIPGTQSSKGIEPRISTSASSVEPWISRMKGSPLAPPPESNFEQKQTKATKINFFPSSACLKRIFRRDYEREA